MSDYTPTTEEVRSRFARIMRSDGTPAQSVTRQTGFDRWLAAHDREVTAKAFREAASEVHTEARWQLEQGRDPDRWLMVERILRDRATRIEKGQEG